MSRALPKRPELYGISSLAESMTLEELNKVVRNIVDGTYRTIFYERWSGFPMRQIKLPDGSIYSVLMSFDIANGKVVNRTCEVGEQELVARFYDGRPLKAGFLKEILARN